jgi:hypothetical protein
MQTWETYITAALSEETDRYAAGSAVAFGSDLSCATDITSTARELSDDDPLIVAQAVYRRLTTPRDGLVDDREYGLDLRTFLHRGLTTAQLRSVEGQIRNEICKDDRVETVSVAVTHTDVGSFSIAIRGETGAAPFSLVLALTDGEALIKEMS